MLHVNRPAGDRRNQRRTQNTTVCTGRDVRKLLDEAQAGDNIGCLLRAVCVKREEIVAPPSAARVA